MTAGGDIWAALRETPSRYEQGCACNGCGPALNNSTQVVVAATAGLRSGTTAKEVNDPGTGAVELEDEPEVEWPEETASWPWPESCESGEKKCGTTVSMQTVNSSDFHIDYKSDSNLDVAMLHEYLQQVMIYYGIPGAAFAILSKDLRLVHAAGLTYRPGFKARGYPTESPWSASSSKMAAVSPTSMFRIASISKSLTAVAVMHLYDQYRAESGANLLQMKIADFFPIVLPKFTFPLSLASLEYPPITVGQLLSHLSGIGEDPSPPTVANELDLSLPVTARDAVDYMWKNYQLPQAPGYEVSYNSYAFQVLGVLIEELTGDDYATYVTKNVLEPYGMVDTLPGDSESSREGEVKYYAQGYSCQCECNTGCSSSHCETQSEVSDDDECVRSPYGASDLSFALATGGWLSTVVDLMRLIRGIKRDRNGAGVVLSRRAAWAMWTDKPQAKYNAATGYDSGQGYGWDIDKNSGVIVSVTKTGRLCGSTSLVTYRPEDGFSYAFLVNSDLPYDCRNDLAAYLNDTLTNQEPIGINYTGASTDYFDSY